MKKPSTERLSWVQRLRKCESQVNDYEHALKGVGVEQLNHLSFYLAMRLPCLAVRCHLAMIKLAKIWDKLTKKIISRVFGC